MNGMLLQRVSNERKSTCTGAVGRSNISMSAGTYPTRFPAQMEIVTQFQFTSKHQHHTIPIPSPITGLSAVESQFGLVVKEPV